MALMARLDAAQSTDEQLALINQATPAEINTPKRSGWTPLRLVISVVKPGECSPLTLVKALLLNGANQTIPAQKGSICPIHEAVRKQKDRQDDMYLDIVKELYANNNECLEIPTAAGLTAIHYAAETLDMTMLHWVFEHTQDKQRLTNEGNTALHYAGATRFLNAFVALYREGFEPHARNHNGHTALDKLLNAWPEVRNAFVDMDRRQQGQGRFMAMTMSFYNVSVDQAQGLSDEVTEQREADWPDTALFVRDLLAVYDVWLKREHGPAGAAP
eukprot:m.2624 g.2624  ORF g.2624 m.2624 type:complete len:273 (-) comp3736_c0_seq1:139-957(-)